MLLPLFECSNPCVKEEGENPLHTRQGFLSKKSLCVTSSLDFLSCGKGAVAAGFPHPRDVLPLSGQQTPPGQGRKGQRACPSISLCFSMCPECLQSNFSAGKRRGEGKKKNQNHAWHEFRKLSSSHIWFLYFKVN